MEGTAREGGGWRSGLALIAGLVLFAGGFLLWVGLSSDALLRRVQATPAQSAPEVERLAPGATVVASGRIDPLATQLDRGLAMYVRDRYARSRGSDGRPRGGGEWERDATKAPPFALLAAGGTLHIRNEGYTLARPTVVETGTPEIGRLRYEGFRAGDSVTVVGVRTTDGVEAEVVFGGTREEYRDSLQDGSGFATRWGWILLSVGLAGMLPAGVAWTARARRGA